MDEFLGALEASGGSAGNGKLQTLLEWDEPTYDEVKADLMAKGIVVTGAGRGGSVPFADASGVGMAVAAAPASAATGNGKAKKANGAGPIGFEAQLWKAADALRNNMDAAEYKHVVLGLLFLKCISDAFETKHAALEAEREQGADPEDPDEYLAKAIFWVPKEARWAHLKAQAPQPTIGTDVDEAMAAIERDNPSLKGVLPKDYARPGLDKQRLGQVINLVSDIGLGEAADRSKDTLGRVYEYFLSRFASAEGKSGGQFYTSSRVVRVLVEMLAPYNGRVYDPCCGSGGMFVQSEKFIEAHAGRIGDISVYSQESNYTTWRLAKMNLAIRGIDAQIAHGDTFHKEGHPDLKADYVLANPPFNDSDWRGDLLKDDNRWAYGTPPPGNANFAWVQHFLFHLAPNGIAGFVLADGSMSSNQSGEGEIRKAIIEADLVDCMVALPGQLFYSTQIPVCLWFLAHSKGNGRFRERRGETLFIDARKLGTMATRVLKELTDADIAKIAGHLPRVARGRRGWRVRRRSRLLQKLDHEGDPQARPCAHAGPLRGCRGRRGRR
ncbi:class I SAM-dependent DNA methyltransferase [Cyanobium sp. LEGE 06143]|uniref:type I restriction-modification system subunit M n=1 Tax=Cyanobium sp. LEGE 06143 TaxID=945727 RepID=UPI001D1462FC|nr:class I SAM-dependent DNA methyltransferase [Cyanobium sp. LEGE 06143]